MISLLSRHPRRPVAPRMRDGRPRRTLCPLVDRLEGKIVLQTFPRLDTLTSLVISPAPSVSFGTPLVLTATVSGQGAYAPAGQVGFLDGTTSLGLVSSAQATLGPNGTAIFTLATSALTVGTHALSAEFFGQTIQTGPGFYDGVVIGSSTSDPVAEEITPALPSTTTDVGQSNSTPTFGATTTLYAVVAPTSGTAPTGSVTFLDGARVIGTAPLITVPGQTYASLPVSSLPLGTHSVTVAYGGDEANGASASAATVITVGPNTAIDAGQSDATPTTAQSTILFAVLKDHAPGTPTGVVTFSDGSKVLGTNEWTTAPGGGQLYTALSVSGLSAGVHSITIFYSGDSANSASAASTTITVAQAPPVV